jgi:hypothetical protein
MMVYTKLQKDRAEQERVMSFTGLLFTSEIFIDIYQNASRRWVAHHTTTFAL